MANTSTEAARTKRTPHVSIKTGDNVKFSQTADCQPLHLGHLDDQDVGAFVCWQIHLRKVAFRYVRLPPFSACLDIENSRQPVPEPARTPTRHNPECQPNRVATDQTTTAKHVDHRPEDAGQLGVVWVIFGAFGARKGDKTSRGAGCEPYSSRPPAVEGSFDLRPPGSAL